MDGIERLLTLRAANKAAGERMAEISPRFEAIANRHLTGTEPKAITGFNLFQTPQNVAHKMAGLLAEALPENPRILEPSAGLGRLVDPLKDICHDWVLVEDELECCKALAKMLKQDITKADFMSTGAELGDFDGVIMNPPFKQGTDIKHILHAYDMLKPGGRLVSLCYNGVKQNKELKPIADYWEILPEGSFKESGTRASVALLILDKTTTKTNQTERN